jgi:integrase
MSTVTHLSPEQINSVRKFLKTYYYSQVIQDIVDAGFQLPLRISDLRKIKFSDIKNGRLFFKATKTGKTQVLSLNSKFLVIVEKRSALGDEYVFQSQSNRAKRMKSPITSSAVYAAMTCAGESLKLNIGTHTFRKSWGAAVYAKTNDLGLVQKALQHGSSSQTLRYIGVDQEKMDGITSSFEL